jgi:peptidoglycan L-alanyl-D-glutamate endopeptidase CwlK
MGYTLGARSRAELAGVHPKLVQCVESAIAITEQDFTVMDGLRTLAEQKVNLSRGVSKTMNSQHLPQADGLGHAVDLVPWINGGPRWEWPPIYRIAAAMLIASRQHGVRLRWGGVWDKELATLAPVAADLETAPAAFEKAVAAYCKRHPGPDFLDGPHFELRGV